MDDNNKILLNSTVRKRTIRKVDNRNKQIIKVTRLHERVVNQRRDILHARSRQIANAYDCKCIKGLDMKAMLQSLYFENLYLITGEDCLQCNKYKK